MKDLTGLQGTELSRTDDYLRVLRHEFSNHINQIIGFSELVSEELSEEVSLDDDLLVSLDKVHNAANSIQDLVREKLTLEGLSITLGRELNHEQSAPKTISNLCDESLMIIQESAHILNEQNNFLNQVNKKILIVDDELQNRQLLKSRLNREGFTVEMAEEGEEALAKLSFEAFDLVLLDILMPKMDGFQTLLHIKRNERTSHIPVIMISALDDLSMVVPCIEAGAEDYLSKPFNRVLLSARITSSLERKQRHDDELVLYQKLKSSKQSLQSTLQRIRAILHDFSKDFSEDLKVFSLLEILGNVVGDLEEQSVQLNKRIKQIEIRINRKAVSSQVNCITSDPSFSNLSSRAKAMREQRRQRSAS